MPHRDDESHVGKCHDDKKRDDDNHAEKQRTGENHGNQKRNNQNRAATIHDDKKRNDENRADENRAIENRADKKGADKKRTDKKRTDKKGTDKNGTDENRDHDNRDGEYRSDNNRDNHLNMNRDDELKGSETPRNDIPDNGMMLDTESFKPEWTADGHVAEDSIYAWLDGAFADADSARIEQHITSCATCSAAVAEARGFIAGAARIIGALDAGPQHVVPHADAARTAARMIAANATQSATIATGSSRNSIDTIAHTRSADTHTLRKTRNTAHWYDGPALRVAAALLVIVGGASYVVRQTNSGLPTSQATTDSAFATVSSSVAQPAVVAPSAMSAPNVLNAPSALSAQKPSTNIAAHSTIGARQSGIGAPRSTNASEFTSGAPQPTMSDRRAKVMHGDSSITADNRSPALTAERSRVANTTSDAPNPRQTPIDKTLRNDLADALRADSVAPMKKAIANEMVAMRAGGAAASASAASGSAVSRSTASETVAAPDRAKTPTQRAPLSATSPVIPQIPAAPAPALPMTAAATLSRSFASRDSTSRLTVVGVVTDGVTPLQFANVSVRGTSINTVTDSTGRFVLNGVPRNARDVETRSIGYKAQNTIVDERSDTTRLTVVLERDVNRLSELVVATTPQASRPTNVQCLRSDNSNANSASPVHLLRGEVKSRGNFSLSVIGWPDVGHSTLAQFVRSAGDTLNGVAKSASSTLTISLTQHGTRWSGMVIERRNGAMHSSSIQLTPDTSHARCSTN